MAAKPSLTDRLKGTFEQFFVWGVLQQIAGAILAPVVQGLQQKALSIDPNTTLTPADVVDAQIKGHMTADAARAEALNSGVNAQRLQTMVDSAGEPPGVETLLFMDRRGIIPTSGTGADSVSLEQGIRESRTKDKWIPALKAMSLSPIPVSDAVDAVVEGQIDYGAGEKIAYQNGISSADFRILVNTRGNPPSPSDLIELVRRGEIPMRGTGPTVTSLQQGIFEGSTKDKWEPAFEALVQQLPPPRTTTALLRNGSIDDARALALFQKAGLSAEDAAAYVADAHHQRTQTERELTKSDILALYQERAIDAQQCEAMLAGLHFSAQDAQFLIAITDFRRAKAQLDSAVGKVRSLFIAHKIDERAVITTLDGLSVPPAQRDNLITTWRLEREVNVQRLTAAEYADAAFYGIMSAQDAADAIEALGFTKGDAQTRVALRFHAPWDTITKPPAGGATGGP
jgi:hypothetical protein